MILKLSSATPRDALIQSSSAERLITAPRTRHPDAIILDGRVEFAAVLVLQVEASREHRSASRRLSRFDVHRRPLHAYSIT